MLTCSLILSTYNWPEALELCLLSISRQSVMPDEIIVCDDGSKPETAALIDTFRDRIKVPLIHIWQPDEGFQLARIRNKGIAAARGEYIIQIDGDLILHTEFVKDHLHFKKKNAFATGSRTLLSAAATRIIFETKQSNVGSLFHSNQNYFNSFRIPVLHPVFAGYKTKGRHKYYVKGCNMAFWKSDLVKVNGYNEDFTGWGREDSEIAIRLINSEVRKRFLKFGAVCYHLYHKETSRQMEQKNIQMMDDAVEKKITRTSNGLDKYVKAG